MCAWSRRITEGERMTKQVQAEFFGNLRRLCHLVRANVLRVQENPISNIVVRWVQRYVSQKNETWRSSTRES